MDTHWVLLETMMENYDEEEYDSKWTKITAWALIILAGGIFLIGGIFAVLTLLSTTKNLGW